MNGHQEIGCKVTSCRYNEDNQACTLDRIEVAPRQNESSGDAKDESMCGSYRNK